MAKTLREHDAGEAVDAICVLAGLTVRQTRQQKPFLRLELNDSSGRIDAVMWDGFDDAVTSLPQGQVLRVRGRMEAYDEKPQVVVNSISALAPGSYDPSEFMPASERAPGEMLDELDGIIASVSNSVLKQLLEIACGDNDFRGKFTQAPAAKRWHQSYIGGLLEHTLNVVAHARALAARYPAVDDDIVTAGALLHDIGKITEYTWEGYLDSSTEGKLVGHLVIGVELLNDWIARIKDFPEPLAWQLKHIVLSHHGSLEYGSPVPPRTLEALVVHFADDLDSKVSGVLKVLGRSQEISGDWTEYIRLMDTKFYKASGSGDNDNPQADSPLAAGKHRNDTKRENNPQEQSLFGGDDY